MYAIKINESWDNAEVNTPGEISVGIDFGTTNSLIAISADNAVYILPDHKNRHIIPSIVSYENEEFIIGDKKIGLDHAITSIKRLMGKSYEEILGLNTTSSFKHLIKNHNNTPKIQCGNKYLTIPEVAAEIFKYLKHQAEQILKRQVRKAVVTVPAYFDDTAKGQVLFAAKIAGFEVLRLVAEPTAAAYAYGLHHNLTGTYLVYDFGGGTFDVSILNIQHGVLQVIATGGDNLLGGDDLDSVIAQYLSNNYKLENSSGLRQIAQTIKEHLTDHSDCSLEFNEKEIICTKRILQNLISPLILRSINIVKNTIEEAGNPKLDGIILVGGTSRIPLITELMRKNFNVEIFSNIAPEKTVVNGAALQAKNLTTSNKSIIVDVLPLSLGIELYGGIVEKIILRNSPIPWSITKEFTTYADNQTAIQFHVLQGERELAVDCRSLARFELSIPPMKAGQIKVEVTFNIDVDGILSVFVFEKTTTKSYSVTINPTFGLNKEEVDRILNEAYQNVASDHHRRINTELNLQVHTLVHELENFLHEAHDMLDITDVNNIKQVLENLHHTITLNNSEESKNTMKKLGKNLEYIGSIMLDFRIEQLLKGKHVDYV